MHNRIIGRPEVKPTRENIKEMIAKAKQQNKDLKNSLQNLLNRDLAINATLSQQTVQIQAIDKQIEDIRNGRIVGAELTALRDQVKNIMETGLRNNTFPNAQGLANLVEADLSKFMELLKHQREGMGTDMTDKIPFFKYETGMRPADDLCSVCHDQYKEGQECSKLECNHMFHRPCIVKWLERKNVCPMCKQTVKIPGVVGGDQNVRGENVSLFFRERRL